MISKMSYQNYMNTVGTKLEKIMPRLMVSGQRDTEATRVYTVNRILQSARNFYFSRGGDRFDPVESFSMGFSAGSGYGDVVQLATRGSEDITILNSILSLMSLLAVERAMDTPEQLIQFEYLKSLNKVGDINIGDTVLSPFTPHNSKIRDGLQTTTIVPEDNTTGSSIVFGPLVKGTLNIRIEGAGDTGTLIGRDYNKDGVIHWSYLKDTDQNTTKMLGVTVNYDTGKVELKGDITKATAKVSVTATIDHTKQSGPDNSILRTKTDYKSELLVATPRNIIHESSLAEEAYRNKALQASIDAGMSFDAGEMAFRQLLQLTINCTNTLLVQGILDAGEIALALQGGKSVQGDISGYSIATSTAGTKDDLVQKFILDLNRQLMENCGMGATCIITGLEGANHLGNVKDRFSPTSDFYTTINGYIGTFNHIPVVRHNMVDEKNTSNTVRYYAIYKDPSGKAGPIAYGEYLPTHATKEAMNFYNPSQYARELFSFSGVKCIVDTLCAVGDLKTSK